MTSRTVLGAMIGVSLFCLLSPLLVVMPVNTFWVGFWLAAPVTVVALWALARRHDPWVAAAAAYPLVPLALLVVLFASSGE